MFGLNVLGICASLVGPILLIVAGPLFHFWPGVWARRLIYSGVGIVLFGVVAFWIPALTGNLARLEFP